MSFSADWLALREPIDHRSVSESLRSAVAEKFAARETVSIVDLGCGSGPNLRGLAPFLGTRQRWTLVDWDENLLAHARAALANWADEANDQPGDATLRLRKNEKHIEVAFAKADLARALETALDPAPDLVTAAAFFDLVSGSWIDGFCAALAARRLPLYTVLTYDGQESWDPPHPADAAMLAAFHFHQQSDKGFGAAAGPHAVEVLSKALSQCGYQVARAPSPWRLAGDDRELISQLARGAAQAVSETGMVPAHQIESWLGARTPARACSIGHEDIFALRG